MPYYLYRIDPPRELKLLATHDQYREARARVRELRGQPEPGVEFRLIFASQLGEAERLLSTPRDERVIGED
jgi:hypothetical protein